MSRMRWIRQMLTLGFLAALVVTTGLAQASAPTRARDIALEVVFLDVGQGDAILIKLGARAVLVDASGGDDIILLLREHGIDSLVAAIASHNHEDHIGGMDAVIADHPIGRYFANGRPPEGSRARSVEDWLRRERTTLAPVPWQPIQLGDAQITVLRPPPLTSDNDAENNSSLGVLIERGGFRALLTGDSELEELSGWMKAGVIPDVDVLKAAHHGARNGVTPGWLDRTKPEVVVVSVGANNTYGHPDPWAMRYYELHRRKVYRTDRDGTVTVRVERDGQYRVETSGPTAR
ncbi:MAG: MBL fold metallo-hydrolase [Gemmatimonadota bacterium]